MNGFIRILTLALLLGPAHAVIAADPAPTAENPAGETAQPERSTPLSRHEAALEALKSSPLDGEKLELQADGKPVFALFSPALGKSRGGVILLHDLGGHVDSPGVIHPLRTRLPEHGWATLAVTLPPVEGNSASAEWLDSSRKVIDAAIGEMRKRNIEPLVLSGHGLGALAATDYLAAGDRPAIKGLVIIGMDGSSNQEPRLDGAAQLGKVRPAILDIYGGHDWRQVLDSAERRADAAHRRDGGEQTAHTLYRDIAKSYSDKKGDNVGYRQIRIAPAAHDFTRQETVLVRRVRGWLQRYVAGK